MSCMLTKSLQVLDAAKRSLPVCNSGIQVVLLSVLVHAETLEVDVSTRAELRLNRTRDVDGALHSQLLHAALHNGELDGDFTRHLNRTAERYLTITLGEVQVSDTELGALDVDREIDLRATRQVLDVAVASVLRPTWNCACTLPANLLFDVVTSATGMDVLRLWGKSDITVHMRASGRQLAFTAIPLCEHLGRRSAAKDTRVDETSKTNVWNMTRRAEDTLKVPDCFGSIRRQSQP